MKRYLSLDFLGSVAIFALVAYIIYSILANVYIGDIIKRGGIVIVVFLVIVDVIIYKIMLLPVIKNKSLRKEN